MLFHPSSFASLFSSSSSSPPLDRLGAWRTSLVGIYSQACQQALHSLLTLTYSHLLPPPHASDASSASPSPLDLLASTSSLSSDTVAVDPAASAKRPASTQLDCPASKRRRISIDEQDVADGLLELARTPWGDELLLPPSTSGASRRTATPDDGGEATILDEDDLAAFSTPPSRATSVSSTFSAALCDDLELVPEPASAEPIRSQAFLFKLSLVDEILFSTTCASALPTADAHDLARAHLVRFVQLEEAREFDYDARRGDVRLASTVVLNAGREHAVACYLEGDNARDERFKQRIERELEVYLAFLDVSPRSHPSLFRRGPPPPPQQTTSQSLVSVLTQQATQTVVGPAYTLTARNTRRGSAFRHWETRLVDLPFLRRALGASAPARSTRRSRRRAEWDPSSYEVQDEFLRQSCLTRAHADAHQAIWDEACEALDQGWDGLMSRVEREVDGGGRLVIRAAEPSSYPPPPAALDSRPGRDTNERGPADLLVPCARTSPSQPSSVPCFLHSSPP
ncbi:hypothetical protein JCM10207_007001 [Rhodosporidiobolus poonsookiae]